MMPAAALRREIGWDDKDCWFAHCCMLDADERAFFAERGIGIAHCPQLQHAPRLRHCAGASLGKVGWYLTVNHLDTRLLATKSPC